MALKVVHADLTQDADRLRRFEHEAKAAGALNHPNIVAVYDTGQHAGSPYIVSELLAGESLRDRLRRGPLPRRAAIDFAAQVAAALAFATQKGLGYYIYLNGSTLFNYPAMYAGVVAMSLLGVGLYFGVDWLEHRLCGWQTAA